MKLLTSLILIALSFSKAHAQAESTSDTLRIQPRDSIVLHGRAHHCYSSRKIKNPLILVNNKKIGKQKIKEIKPESVKSINVVNGLQGRIRYGIRGRHGVILIETY